MNEVVYLLHFDRPHPDFKRKIQHYIGWTVNLDRRIKQHRDGKGAALARVMRAAGVGFEVVRTWPCDGPVEAWELEKALKAKKKASGLCPVCRLSLGLDSVGASSPLLSAS